MDTKVYEDLPDLRQLCPDISDRYATLDSLKEKNPKIKGRGKGKLNLDPMDVLLKQLPLSRTREQIDQLSASFCPLSPSKANCNSLAERLFDVDKLELVPLYARMVATLSKCMPAFSDALFTGLLDEILKVLPKKSKDKVERKLVVISFIGKLCLFGVAPPTKVLQILKACLLDTENHQVAKLLVRICGNTLLHDAETVGMMKSIIMPQIEGLEKDMVEHKQCRRELEAEEEKEVERKNELVRVEQERAEEKRLEKHRIVMLKEEEEKKKDGLKKHGEKAKDNFE